jgi:hypothetical protein
MLGVRRAARPRVLRALGVSAVVVLCFWCYLRERQRTFDADPGELAGRAPADGKAARTYPSSSTPVLVYDDNVLRQLRRFYYP